MGSYSASFCPQNKDFWHLCYGSEVDYPICVWLESILLWFGFVLFLDFPVNGIGGHRPSNLYIYIFLLLGLSCGLWAFMILVYKLKFIICSLLGFTKWFSLLGKAHQTWYTWYTWRLVWFSHKDIWIFSVSPWREHIVLGAIFLSERLVWGTNSINSTYWHLQLQYTTDPNTVKEHFCIDVIDTFLKTSGLS